MTSVGRAFKATGLLFAGLAVWATSAWAFSPWRNYWNWGPLTALGWGWNGSWLGLLAVIFFWILAIAVVVMFFRWLFSFAGFPRRSDRPAGRALDILGERYAKGEISPEAFLEIKKALSDQARHS